MKLSLITPTYKRLNFLNKNYKILKKLNKKYPKLFEWILLTEKSDTASVKQIRKYKEKFIIHVNKNFKNNDHAFNYGVKKSNGNLLVIYGDDDFINFEFLKEVKKNYSKEIKWYIGYGEYVDLNGRKFRKITTKIKSFLLDNYSNNLLTIINFIMTPSVCFSKNEFNKIKGLNQSIKYASDYLLWLEFSKNFKPKIIKKFISKATFSSKTKTGSFSFHRYLDMFRVMRKYQKNYILQFIQLLVIVTIAVYNFVKKKIFLR